VEIQDLVIGFGGGAGSDITPFIQDFLIQEFIQVEEVEVQVMPRIAAGQEEQVEEEQVEKQLNRYSRNS
jgi:hypothetical protein